MGKKNLQKNRGGMVKEQIYTPTQGFKIALMTSITLGKQII